MHTSEVSPFERHFYRMPIAGGHAERITTGVGGHTVVVSPNELLLNGKGSSPALSTRRSRILRRIQRLEELPQAEQKAVLKILDGLLDRRG